MFCLIPPGCVCQAAGGINAETGAPVFSANGSGLAVGVALCRRFAGCGLPAVLPDARPVCLVPVAGLSVFCRWFCRLRWLALYRWLAGCGLPCASSFSCAGCGFAGSLSCAGCGLPVVCRWFAGCGLPVAVCRLRFALRRLRVCRCFAGCGLPVVCRWFAGGLPVVCPAPVDWVVAVALFSVSGTAAGSGGKPPPVRKTEKNHSTKKTDVPTEHPEKRGEIFRKYYNYFCVGVRNIGFLINPIRV